MAYTILTLIIIVCTIYLSVSFNFQRSYDIEYDRNFEITYELIFGRCLAVLGILISIGLIYKLTVM